MVDKKGEKEAQELKKIHNFDLDKRTEIIKELTLKLKIILVIF